MAVLAQRVSKLHGRLVNVGTSEGQACLVMLRAPLAVEWCATATVPRRISTIMAENEQKNVPSELVINEKWDTCLERTVINFGIGLVSAGVAGVVLTRAPGMRRAVMGFGAGCGVGSSWIICSQDFAKK